MFIVMKLAAIVAVQSPISATFSIIIIRQAGRPPRLLPTGDGDPHFPAQRGPGEVYSSEANCMLMALCVRRRWIPWWQRETSSAFGIHTDN